MLEPEVLARIDEAISDLDRQCGGRFLELRQQALDLVGQILAGDGSIAERLRAADLVLRHGGALDAARMQTSMDLLRRSQLDLQEQIDDLDA